LRAAQHLRGQLLRVEAGRHGLHGWQPVRERLLHRGCVLRQCMHRRRCRWPVQELQASGQGRVLLAGRLRRLRPQGALRGQRRIRGRLRKGRPVQRRGSLPAVVDQRRLPRGQLFGGSPDSGHQVRWQGTLSLGCRAARLLPLPMQRPSYVVSHELHHSRRLQCGRGVSQRSLRKQTGQRPTMQRPVGLQQQPMHGGRCVLQRRLPRRMSELHPHRFRGNLFQYPRRGGPAAKHHCLCKGGGFLWQYGEV
jgi:hypothetical protein